MSLLIVCGPPASGKTTVGRRLAEKHRAVFLDSDIFSPLIEAGLASAGADPDDRDSAFYKEHYRDAVYETLWGLCESQSKELDIVVAGPFTRELQQQDWSSEMQSRLGRTVRVLFVHCDSETRRKRMRARGCKRDVGKLRDWDQHVQLYSLPKCKYEIVES